MKALRELRARWAQASLEYDLAHGRRAYGRSAPGEGSRVDVDAPVAVTIEAVVIRADGTREDLGVISQNQQAISGEKLERIVAAAARQQRRGRR